MAIDFLIFGLLLVSFTINLLALGAFWVTPALRTTANRFVINLLIINLVGCVILAPTLFLTGNGGSISSAVSQTTFDERSIEIISKAGEHEVSVRHNGKLIENEGIIRKMNATETGSTNDRTVETFFKCNSTFCQELTIEETSDTIVITEVEEKRREVNLNENKPHWKSVEPPTLRCWSIDLAAALGALAVLLVVGDTWCAVTDPLRYHSRISGLKAWIFIALTWSLGIFFGVLSAFREIDFEATTIVAKQKRYADQVELFNMTTTGNIFDIVYACVYFIVIILLPFGFVCGMYWRIFSEARENGLRMRQNGSSPLLQSALNLTHHHQQQQQQQQHQTAQYSNSLYVHRNSLTNTSQGGLQMKIDHRRSGSPSIRRDSGTKVLLPPISDDGGSDGDADSTKNQVNAGSSPIADRNQNILLTLSVASGEIKRNYSARQLPLLGTSSQDLMQSNGIHGIRLVHSSPNLQRYAHVHRDSLTESCSTHLQAHMNHHRIHNHHVHHQELQIPAIHGSPKALSYMTSIRHRLSNASSLFKYREESRAARISILVVIMFLVSYLPYGFLVLLQSRLVAANFTYSTQLSIFMIVLGNLTSPFIFAYRNKRVRRGVKRLLGFEILTEEQKLQRQSSSSGRESGLLRKANGTKASISVKRSGSKVSTYSLSSCKYLTPQPSLTGAAPVHQPSPSIRPNSSCSTIINFNVNNNNNYNNSNKLTNNCLNNNNNNNNVNVYNSFNLNNGGSLPLTTSFLIDEKLSSPLPPVNKSFVKAKSPRPKLQRGTTIIEHIPLGQKLASEKRSIFKMFCHSSKSLSSAAKSYAKKADIEPTAV